MIGHLSLGVSDLGLSTRFYDQVLSTIGYVRLTTSETSVGYGRGGGDATLVLLSRAIMPSTQHGPGKVSLSALHQSGVAAFHLAGLAYGGQDAGAPASRGRGTFTAAVTDPDGHQVEAMYMTEFAAAGRGAPLLDIQGLKTHFKTDDGWVKSVDGIDIAIHKGETVGIVGESGCGKTVTAMSVLKLIPMPPGQIVGGKILWQGRDLVPLTTQEMDEIRAKEIAIIFQEPMTSLNPVYTVGDQIIEVLRRHEGMNGKQALDRTVELLSLVQIPNPGRRVHDYPHQFSGGMRQRVMIAMALACNPKLLIADEPTTALDVTIQAQILELMQDLKDRLGMSIMLITHAMGVVAEVTQRVVVMYAGRVVEEATVEELFANPRHPYTQGLIRSIPRIDHTAKKQRLEAIAGTVPSLLHPPIGCRFAARCKFAMPECKTAQPPLKQVSPSHKVACIL